MIGWSTKRKVSHAFILSLAVFFVVIAAFFFFVYRSPSCSDGLKNQGEAGVDCGGPCPLLCFFEVNEPVVYWQRAFMIRPGFYHLVAYMENKNQSESSPRVPYYFKVYDVDNVLIAERFGQTFLGTNKVSAVFESNVSTGGRVPVRVVFGFDGDSVWRVDDSVYPRVSVHSTYVDHSGGFSVLSAVLENTDVRQLRDFEVVAILYDETGNARTASKTEVDFLDAQSDTRISFTWPRVLDFTVGRIEVLPKIYPGLNY